MRRLLLVCMAFALVMSSTAAFAGLQIYVNKSTQRMTVKENGKVRYTWKVSTGKGEYQTPSGTFSVKRLVRHHYSTNWKVMMDNAIFFDSVNAIHATPAVSRLGQPASHGCVRLAPGNAAALFALVIKHGSSTKIIIR